MIDRDVYDKNDKLIREVEDIIIRRSGKIKKLIIEYGKFLDIADRLVSPNFKPWPDLRAKSTPTTKILSGQ